MGRVQRALAVGAALAIVVLTAYASEPRDFCTYYTAGLVANEDGVAAVFDLDQLNQRHAELHPEAGRRVGHFYYSPLFLGLASILARLDFGVAQALNQLLILLSLGGILYFALEPPRPTWLLTLLFAAFVLCDPVHIQFLYQNWTAHLVLLIILALRQTLRGRNASAVLCWALAMHLKLYVVAFLVPLWFLSGQEPTPGSTGNSALARFFSSRRLVLGTLAVFFLLLALPLPWTGLEGPASYLGALASEAGADLTVFYNEISIPATLARFSRTPLDWVTSNRLVESWPLKALLWVAAVGFVWASRKLARLSPVEKGPARALALTVPFLLLFLPKAWDHGELLFFVLFATGVLTRRVEAITAGLLVLSFAYFPLVQHLLEQALRGEIAPLQVQALLFFYPLLNLLAAATLLQSEPPPERT